MKRLGLALLVMVACEEAATEKNAFTGNEVVYNLKAGSEYNVSGTVTIKEQTDLNAKIFVELTGIDAVLEHPVHLHLGSIGTPGAEIAALLAPINTPAAKSETVLSQLADESAITYAQLLQLEACIKVHLADSGPERDVILAAGNIGTAVLDVSNARTSIAICK